MIRVDAFIIYLERHEIKQVKNIYLDYSSTNFLEFYKIIKELLDKKIREPFLLFEILLVDFGENFYINYNAEKLDRAQQDLFTDIISYSNEQFEPPSQEDITSSIKEIHSKADLEKWLTQFRALHLTDLQISLIRELIGNCGIDAETLFSDLRSLRSNWATRSNITPYLKELLKVC